MEFRKLTEPIPSGRSTRAAYGNVIKGKIIPVKVFIKFKIILNFKDFIDQRDRLINQRALLKDLNMT